MLPVSNSVLIASTKTLLIIPCYNEAARMSLPAFDQFLSAGNYLCFADDGSTDGTAEMLQRHFQSKYRVSLFRSAKNLGKAGIIREAIMSQITKGLPAEVDWIGFWDADLATPLEEVQKFLRFQADFAPQAKAIIGSRVLRLGANIKRSALRHYLGRVFATFAAVMLGVGSYDSQCGAKLFHRTVVASAFGEAFISRWIFDLEILLRIGEANIVEYPVSQWEDIPGSKIRVVKEIFRVFRDLLSIRSRYR